MVEAGPANSPAGRRSGGSALATPVRVTGPVARPFAGILPEGYQALPPPPAEQLVARSVAAQKLEGVKFLAAQPSRIPRWRKGVINAACRSRSTKMLNGEPVSHVAYYYDDESQTSVSLVLKRENYATSEESVPGAWLLIEKVSCTENITFNLTRRRVGQCYVYSLVHQGLGRGRGCVRARVYAFQKCAQLTCASLCRRSRNPRRSARGAAKRASQGRTRRVHGMVCEEPVHHMCSNKYVDSGVEDDLRQWCRKCVPKLRK